MFSNSATGVSVFQSNYETFIQLRKNVRSFNVLGVRFLKNENIMSYGSDLTSKVEEIYHRFASFFKDVCIWRYLSDHQQCVKIGYKSSLFPVKSKGEYLGPLLSILFINDVAEIFTYYKCLLLADSLKPFSTVTSFATAINMQHDTA